MTKKFVLLILLVSLNIIPVLSQEDTSERFSYRSFSISPFGLFAGNDVGIAFEADISFDYGKNIFSLEVGAGSEVGVFQHNDNFNEVNLLYGRSYPLSEKLFTEIFVGAGFFYFSSYGMIDSEKNKRGEINERTIGFPIGGKLQFRLGPRYSMGIRLAANINSVETIGTVGLVLQWNRKRP